MDWWIIAALIASALLIPTAYAGLIGAPWAPTRMAAVRKAFDEIGVSDKDTVLDLGAGDGSIIRETAKRNAQAIGYELSPIMWVVALLRTFGLKNATIVYGNFFKKKLPDSATIIFLFLMPTHMEEVANFLSRQNINDKTLVLSYAFAFPRVQALTTYREKKCAPLYLYKLSVIREHFDPKA